MMELVSANSLIFLKTNSLFLVSSLYCTDQKPFCENIGALPSVGQYASLILPISTISQMKFYVNVFCPSMRVLILGRCNGRLIVPMKHHISNTLI